MRSFSYLWRYSPGVFALAVITSIVSGATGASFVVVVNIALGRPEGERAALAGVFVALTVTTIVTRVIAQTLLYRLSQGVVRQLRRTLIDRFLDAPLRTAEKLGAPKMLSALSDDVTMIGNAMPGVPAICSNLTFAVVAIGYLAVVSPVVALAALGAAVVGVVLYRAFSRHGTRLLRRAREDQDTLFESFQGITSGVKELKLNRQRRAAIAGEQLDDVAASFRRYSIMGQSVYEGAAGAGQLVFFGFIGVLLFALPSAVHLPVQTLTSSVLILIFMVTNLQGVLVWLPVIGRASVALLKVEERLDALAPEHPVDDLPTPGESDGVSTIALRQVTHVYPGPAGESFVLGPLELELRRGEVVFIVGGNGSGKTTLAKLITGLYVPDSGQVCIDGRPVHDADRDQYRQLFSAVFSDFFVFEGVLGLPDEDRAARTADYLERLQLQHKVSLVGDRFSTTALSQGQRKRLSLLTAYLEDRPCYLFDEWAADQDPAFKRFFYKELIRELRDRGKLVVVISHDDRYFDVADRVIRLDDGQIREGGHVDVHLQYAT
jgi:putative pyoverdin transport system ATP-binding/permease protein